MQLKKRASLNAQDRHLLYQCGITKDLQIKISKLKLYTFKGVTGKKCGNEKKHLPLKLEELSSVQINCANCSKKTKGFKCSQCRYIDFPSRLKSHSVKHLVVTPKPFKCELCVYSAGRKTDLVRHNMTHTGEKAFKCALCTSKFYTQNNLNDHIYTHTGEKFHQCQFCKKQFSTSSSKNGHEKICMMNPKQADKTWVENQKKFKCTVCNYSVISKYRLQVHLKKHTDERKFECKLCSSKFKSLVNLHQHIITHTGEKPFPCQFCNRAFALKGNMNSHEQVCKLNPKQSDKNYREQLKTFKCQECSYSVRTKGDFMRHLRSHTEEKTFACTLCSQKCWTKSDLNVHIMTHTKEKPHKCPHCEFTSALQYNLKKHVNARHNQGVRRKNFSCEICPRSYFAKHGLKRHVLSHTGERPRAC